jgi:hypothetical protein
MHEILRVQPARHNDCICQHKIMSLPVALQKVRRTRYTCSPWDFRENQRRRSNHIALRNPWSSICRRCVGGCIPLLSMQCQPLQYTRCYRQNSHCAYFSPCLPLPFLSSTLLQKSAGSSPCWEERLAAAEQYVFVPPGFSLSPMSVWGVLYIELRNGPSSNTERTMYLGIIILGKC